MIYVETRVVFLEFVYHKGLSRRADPTLISYVVVIGFTLVMAILNSV
jgi:hypothetical protein